MSDPYSLDFDSLAFRFRQEFAVSAAPARRMVPASDVENAMEAHWLQMARRLGRMPYHEAPGFAGGRGPLRVTVHGYEKPYGLTSRGHWHYIWLAMKCAARAAWYDAVGQTREEVVGGNRTMAVIKGITS